MIPGSIKVTERVILNDLVILTKLPWLRWPWGAITLGSFLKPILFTYWSLEPVQQHVDVTNMGIKGKNGQNCEKLLMSAFLAIFWLLIPIISTRSCASMCVTGPVKLVYDKACIPAILRLTALFTKPPYGLPPYRTTSGGHSCWQLPLTANGHFSVPQELYQANQWNNREPWSCWLCE